LKQRFASVTLPVKNGSLAEWFNASKGRGLPARGIHVGKERVRKLMQRHGICARGKQRFTAPHLGANIVILAL
jgi:hypothetical protein